MLREGPSGTMRLAAGEMGRVNIPGVLGVPKEVKLEQHDIDEMLVSIDLLR